MLVNPQSKVDFVLTDTSGQEYHFLTRTEGKVALLYFGYTHCPDICPVHLAHIASALEDNPVADEVEVVFVSVDPGRDSLSDIRAYLDHFDSRFVGLTGTADDLAAVQRAVGVPEATFSEEESGYSVNHAAWVIAYAPDGMSYSIYPFGTQLDTWTHDLEVLAQLTG